MSDERLHRAMARYFELWGAPNTEDNIAQQVAYAAREIERGELPDHVVAVFRRANELRASHKASGTGAPEVESGPLPGVPRSIGSGENQLRIPEPSDEKPCICAEIIALINVAQQALDSLIVERRELVRLQQSTHDVDTAISAARMQLSELHQAAVEHPNSLSRALSAETLNRP
jgi:hypothetical protein